MFVDVLRVKLPGDDAAALRSLYQTLSSMVGKLDPSQASERKAVYRFIVWIAQGIQAVAKTAGGNIRIVPARPPGT